MARIPKGSRMVLTNLKGSPSTDAIRFTGHLISKEAEKFIGTVANVRGQVVANQRIEEATAAVQATNFQRDAEGRLIMPSMPDTKGGFFGPKLYDTAYAKSMAEAFSQRLSLDAGEKAVDLARKHYEEPEAFRREYSAWAEGMLENIPDDYKAGFSAQIEARGLQTYGAISNQRAERDFRHAKETRIQSLESDYSDLYNIVESAGPTGEAVALTFNKIIADIEKGRMLGQFSDGEAKERMNQAYANIAFADLSRKMSSIEAGADPLDNVAAEKTYLQQMEFLNSFASGKSFAKWVNFNPNERHISEREGSAAEMIPDPEVRKAIAESLRSQLTLKEKTRNAVVQNTEDRITTDTMNSVFEESLQIMQGAATGFSPELVDSVHTLMKNGSPTTKGAMVSIIDFMDSRMGVTNQSNISTQRWNEARTYSEFLANQYPELVETVNTLTTSRLYGPGPGGKLIRVAPNADRKTANTPANLNRTLELLASEESWIQRMEGMIRMSSSGSQMYQKTIEEMQRKALQYQSVKEDLDARFPDSQYPQLVQWKAEKLQDIMETPTGMNAESVQYADLALAQAWGIQPKEILAKMETVSADEMDALFNIVDQGQFLPKGAAEWLKGALSGGMDQEKMWRVNYMMKRLYENPSTAARLDSEYQLGNMASLGKAVYYQNITNPDVYNRLKELSASGVNVVTPQEYRQKNNVSAEFFFTTIRDEIGNVFDASPSEMPLELINAIESSAENTMRMLNIDASDSGAIEDYTRDAITAAIKNGEWSESKYAVDQQASPKNWFKHSQWVQGATVENMYQYGHEIDRSFLPFVVKTITDDKSAMLGMADWQPKPGKNIRLKLSGQDAENDYWQVYFPSEIGWGPLEKINENGDVEPVMISYKRWNKMDIEQRKAPDLKVGMMNR